MLRVTRVSRILRGCRWIILFLDRLSCRMDVSSDILKSSTSSNSSRFKLLSIKLLIRSILLLESQNMALLRMSARSNSTYSSLFCSSWEPSKKSSLLASSFVEDYYFFFLNAFDIFKIYKVSFKKNQFIHWDCCWEISFIIFVYGGRFVRINWQRWGWKGEDIIERKRGRVEEMLRNVEETG